MTIDSILADGAAETQRPAVPTESLADIAAWVSDNFHLPPPRNLPNIELAPQERIAEIRYKGLANGRLPPAATPGPPTLDGEEVVAVYVHTTQTIYLPDTWRGKYPKEQSVLVHEMVHHMQHQGNIKYPCSEAREKLAYQAQESWLGRFGRTLVDEFGIDRITLLVRTNCMF